MRLDREIDAYVQKLLSEAVDDFEGLMRTQRLRGGCPEPARRGPLPYALVVAVPTGPDAFDVFMGSNQPPATVKRLLQLLVAKVDAQEPVIEEVSIDASLKLPPLWWL
jgi:hypothetical protein